MGVVVLMAKESSRTVATCQSWVTSRVPCCYRNVSSVFICHRPSVRLLCQNIEVKSCELGEVRKVGVEGWEQGLHLDHVVALAKGGNDTLTNVKPSHGLCNIKKNVN